MVQVRRDDELSVGDASPPLVGARLDLTLLASQEKVLPLVCLNCGATMYDVHALRRCLRCFYVD